MTELSPSDRPREKLLAHGARALGDNELVALGVANELLTARGGLHGLVQARCDDLARVTGIGPARAARVVAAVEQFGVVLLDTRHRVLRTAVLTVGTLNSTSIEPRDVFREATLGGAAALVVFHNHPSGDPTPSPDDVEMTRRLVAAGVLMGIDVVDHMILGDVRYCSFKEMGQI